MPRYTLILDSEDKSSGTDAEPVYDLGRARWPGGSTFTLSAAVVPQLQVISASNNAYDIAGASGTIAVGFYTSLDAILTALAAASSGTTCTYDTVANKVTISRAGTFTIATGSTLTAWLGFGAAELSGAASCPFLVV